MTNCIGNEPHQYVQVIDSDGNPYQTYSDTYEKDGDEFDWHVRVALFCQKCGAGKMAEIVVNEHEEDEDEEEKELSPKEEETNFYKKVSATLPDTPFTTVPF